MAGTTTPLYVGDITAYTRYVAMTYLILFAVMGSLAGFVFSKNIGLIITMIMLAIIIFALWTVTPGKKIIEFREDGMVILEKGIVKKYISYDAARKFECVNRPKWRAYFELVTENGKYTFCEKDGDKWRVAADKLMALLHRKNCSIMIEEYSYETPFK